ncbi:MAG: hypothetical protein JWM31_382 [Solirubrobacterales bacterium]|nr:hypothetical protein [Solirubrobacterales bacterium]
MSTTITEFDSSRLGQWGDPLEFAVERERAVAYAAATNDPTAAHLAGTYAPPVFAVVPALETLVAAIATIVPGEVMMRGVHGEQDMVFHRPIEPDTTVTIRAVPLGIQVRSSGTIAVVKAEIRTASDELVNEQWMSYFVRGVTAAGSVGEDMPHHGFDETLRTAGPVDTVAQQVDENQTYRYSEASGDPMPIHLDAEFAQAMGLPGIIAHGLCTMAFTSHALIASRAGGDPTRLRRLAVRFAKPVLPGQRITTAVYEANPTIDVDRFAYETATDDGTVVIKDGLAEIRR